MDKALVPPQIGDHVSVLLSVGFYVHGRLLADSPAGIALDDSAVSGETEPAFIATAHIVSIRKQEAL